MLEKVREPGCRKTVDSYRLEDPGFITVTWRERESVCVCAHAVVSDSLQPRCCPTGNPL